MPVEQEQSGGGLAEALRQFGGEFADCWRRLPNKGLFLGLLAAWLAMFYFLGNSTFGYIPTPSLYTWMLNAYRPSPYAGISSEDTHGTLVPFVVLVLMWWKRKELMASIRGTWSPALLLLAAALLLHLLGYVVQQARISIVALFLGVYALMGLAWGPRWLRASFFPYVLFVFCVPMGSLAEPISFPLRLLVTKIVTFISQAVLGIDVVADGTKLFNPERRYEYEIAAACSGIRSLIATIAIGTIYAFLSLRRWWKRLLLIASAVPLAVVGNVFRMMTIVIAAEARGQAAGAYVHENAIISLLPYVPAIGGLLLLGRWLERGEAAPIEERKEALP